MNEDTYIDRWRGTRSADTPTRYSLDDIAYELAAKFLDDGGPVEDWGCGGSYAKKFFVKSPYTGIDGTGDFADVVADLRFFTSHTHGILIRGVLEHNFDWQIILKNAIASCEKLCLSIFTPWSDGETKQIFWTESCRVPDLSFKKSDITSKLPPYTEETVATATQYGTET